ncbi:hypothetical protein [Methanovulcanius yangii]|uniref:hypothetical protein n=1 Tax=Methanovulcanius yangii TaxID=1789227 RepID=UPI0029CA2899|nr:hypothetical protein [Methanovulcanius yangii]
MKSAHSFPLIFIVFLLFGFTCVFPVVALQMAGNPDILPGDILIAGDEASVTLEVLYSVSSMSEYMDLTTGLSDARWRVEILSDGRVVGDVSRSGRYAGITGFELFNGGYTRLIVHLNGTVTEGFYGSGEQTLMSIDHIAADGVTVMDTVEVTAVFLTADDVEGLRMSAEADLRGLGDLISLAYDDGTDTTAVEETYAEAEDLIAASSTMPTVQAFSVITSAGEMIAEATSELSERMYLQTITEAEGSISRTETLLGQYEQIPGYDPDGVMIVRSGLENAGTLLILAEEKKNSGDDSSALSYAQEGRSKAENAQEYLGALTAGTHSSGEMTPTPSSTSNDTADRTPLFIDPGMMNSSDSEGPDFAAITELLGTLWGGVTGGVEWIYQLADVVNDLIG